MLIRMAFASRRAICKKILQISIPILLAPICEQVSAATWLDSINILFHFHGTTDSSQIGSRVKGIGDINNDGYDDIGFNSSSPVGAYISYGAEPSDSMPDLFIRGGVTGSRNFDFTGDGIFDLITTLSSINRVFLYRGFIDSLESVASDSISEDGAVAFGSRVEAGLVNSDMIADILIGDRNNPGGGKIYYYDNPFVNDKVPDWTFELNNNSHTLFSLTLVDFNGDSNEDAIVALKADLDSISYVYIFLGPNFADTPNFVLSAPPEFDSLDRERFGDAVFNIGDINGDTWDDLGIIFELKALIYLCGPLGDSLHDYVLQGGAISMSSAGDINGDGFNDLLAGEGRTLDGVVDIYLGGNIFDIFYDESIYRSDLPPLFLNRIGYSVSSAGDFNNDGYDDILFACQNFFGGDPGDVFVVAGSSDIITDIGDPPFNFLPNEYELYQNYPNPFNSTTTIKFNLPRRSHVTIDILNLNGQLVKRIVSSDLSAGNHSAFWDGDDSEGNTVSSGVYLYVLKSGEVQLGKKLLLIK